MLVVRGVSPQLLAPRFSLHVCHLLPAIPTICTFILQNHNPGKLVLYVSLVMWFYHGDGKVTKTPSSSCRHGCSLSPCRAAWTAVRGLDVQMGLSFCLSSFFIVRSWSMLYCLPEVTTFICLFSQECLTSMGLWCLKGESGSWLFCSTTNWLDQVLSYSKFPALDWQRQPTRSLLTFWNICQRSDWDASAWTGTSEIGGSGIETPLGC